MTRFFRLPPSHRYRSDLLELGLWLLVLGGGLSAAIWAIARSL